MNKTYDVYGIGNALVDLQFRVEDNFLEANDVQKGVMTLVDEDKQYKLINAINPDNTEQKPGGSAANTIIAVSQLGGRAFYSCKVAHDTHGEFYINDMHNNGIDTNFLHQKPEDGITGKCLVMITPDAERTMNTYLGITSNLSTREVNAEAIKNAKYVYIEGYLTATDKGYEAMQQAKNIANANSVKTTLTLSDPSIVEGFNDRLHELTRDPVDILFCNEDEALNFTGTDDFSEALEKLKKSARQFAVTQGASGSVLYDGSQLIDIAPIQVKAVDTNGAGDMFAGAFLYGITGGMSFEEAGQLASRTSAKVVSQYGPRLSREQMQALRVKNATFK